MRILAEDAIAELPETHDKMIETPTKSKFMGVEGPPISRICAISIVRAGDSLLEAVRESLPGVSVGKILIQRREDTEEKLPDLFYKKLPPGIEKKVVLLCDPMVSNVIIFIFTS